MSDRVQITIEARENASRVFGQVGRAAQQMGDQVENAGDGFEELEQSSQNAERSLADMGREFGNVALGVGVMIGGLAKAGQSFRDQEIALRTLERGYGDASDEMEAFAEQIQDTTNFSNDAAVSAANTAATLARNYGFTFEEIQRVLQISADLAAATGFSLEDATQRVVAALRGEAEAAEQLGLTMNQAAIDSENLTLSMSNQEAGHFRLNALIEQSAFALGSAAEQADTTYGSVTDVGHAFQDAAQSIGEMLGPFGELGAYAADNALQIGVMTIALGQLVSAAASANAILGATGLAGALAGISKFTGPALGLALVAADLALATEAGEDSNEIFNTAAEAIDILRQSADDFAASNSISDAMVSLSDDIASTFEHFDRLQERFNELEQLGDDRTGEEDAVFESLGRQFGNVAESALQLVPAIEAVHEILDATGPSAEDAQQALAELDEQVDKGEITFLEYLTGVQDIADGLGAADRASRAAARGQEALNAQLEIAKNNWNELSVEAARAQSAMTGGEVQAFLLEQQTEAAANAADALAEAQEAWQEYADAALEAVQAVDSASELFDTLQRTIIGNTDAIASQFDGLLEWADGLIAVQGEYSKLDELLSAGRISTESYTQAQLAYNDIAAQTAQVQEDVFTIQAKLAPALGAAAVAYGEQVHAISLLRGEALLLQVGLLDATEQQRAFDLATAAANASTDAQVRSVQGMILSAANADPVLAALLDDMGLIDAEFDELTGEVKSIQITGEGFDTVGNQMDELISSIEALTDTQLTLVALLDDDPFTNTADDVRAKLEALDGEVAHATLDAEDNATPKVVVAEEAFGNFSGKDYSANLDATDNASATVGEVQRDLDNFSGKTYTATATVEVDSTDFTSLIQAGTDFFGGGGSSLEVKASVSIDKSQFDSGISEASSRLSAFSGETGTATADAANDAALSAIDAASDALSGWGGSSGTAQVNANDNASGIIASVSGALSALNGRTATTYINTVYTTTFQTVGSAPPIGLGGVAGYAAGGVVAEMAEWGPEMLHFPNGGTALAMSRGIYAVPQGTYVDTAPATAPKLSGMGSGVTFNNYGTIIGIPDLERQITRTISEGLRRANAIHRSSFA